MEKQMRNPKEHGDAYKLINKARKGVEYKTFKSFAEAFPIKREAWSDILNLSERTLQRYERTSKRFEPSQSEKILLIMNLVEKGVEIFGSKDKFRAWINIQNIALGGNKPIDLFDNFFGITMVSDELTKIEYGDLI